MTATGARLSTRLAATVWLAGAIAYFAAEFLAIRAFTPTYSIAHNFISDLGVPECGNVFQGRPICSPRHDLMNAALVLEGAAFFAGAVLMQAAIEHGRNVRLSISAALFCLGMTLIAIFHGANAAEADGTFVLHVLGALVAIISSNVALLSSRWSPMVTGSSAMHRRMSVGLAAISVAAFAVLTLAQLSARTILVGDGIWERMILYPILGWQLGSAIGLLCSPRVSTGSEAVIA